MTTRHELSKPQEGTGLASPGAIGGAGDEAGGAHRAAVAVHLIVAGLTGSPTPEAMPADMKSPAGGTWCVPRCVLLETDQATDDIGVDFDGVRALVQAKLHAGFPLLKRVLCEQWLPAAVRSDWLDRTVLVLATDQPTLELRSLGRAWSRRQDPNAGAPSGSEAAALRKWDAQLVDALTLLDPADRALARRRVDEAVVLMVIAGSGPESPAWQLSQARLADSVVPSRQAAAAMNALTEAVRVSARRRSGGQIRDWIQVLRDAGLDLIARADGVTAARIAAEDEALLAFRTTLAAHLNRLPLHQLGVVLPDLRVPGLADGISIIEVTDEAAPGQGLLDEIRAYRRMLLLGSPGAGKSEALRQLAAFAADPANGRATDPHLETTWPDLGPWAPLPLLVPLTRLLPRGAETRDMPIVVTLDRVADIATEQLDARSRPLVAALAERAMRMGPALLLLDGLDECRDRRAEMVARLGDLMPQLHDEVTVVLASRIHGSEDAAVLAMEPVTLTSPQNLRDATDAVLSAFAQRQSESSREGWLRDRKRWLSRQQEGHHGLFDLPLMALLATVVAGQAEHPAQLPRGRAGLVTAVLDLFIDQWETRRDEQGLGISSLAPATAVAAMTETFTVIAHELERNGSAPEAEISKKIAAVLLERYLPAAGQAEHAAKQMLWAWQEGGVLLRSDDGSLRPRLRLFVEVGESLHATKRPNELAQWVEARLNEKERHEELLLAAELSVDVPAILVQRLESAEPTELVSLVDRATLCAEVMDAAGPSPEASRLRTRFADLVLTAVDVLIGVGPDAEPGVHAPAINDEYASRVPVKDDESTLWGMWRLVELYLESAVKPQLTDEGARIVAALPPEYARLALASMWTQAMFGGRLDGEADLDAVEGARGSLPQSAISAWTGLLVEGSPEPPTDPRATGFDALLNTNRHSRTLVIAAAAVLPDRADLAARVAQLHRHLGRHYGDQLQTVLTALGHEALLEDYRKEEHRMGSQMTAWLTRDDDRTWLEGLSALAPLASLTPWQRWRLAELGALVWLYDLGQLLVNEHVNVLSSAPQAQHDLDRVAIELLGLPLGVVAAQAQQLLDAYPRGEMRWGLMSILYRVAAPVNVDWTHSHDPTADRATLLAVLATGHRMLVHAALRLLENHPDRHETAGLLADQLPRLRAQSQYITAAYAALMGGNLMVDRLAADDAPLVRAGAGRVLLAAGGPRLDMERLRPIAQDPDQSVRALTFGEGADRLSDSQRAQVLTWVSSPSVQSTCIHCGHTGTTESTSCEKCHLGLPSLSDQITGERHRETQRRRRRRHL